MLLSNPDYVIIPRSTSFIKTVKMVLLVQPVLALLSATSSVRRVSLCCFLREGDGGGQEGGGV